ncbi:RelA/SpoT family protein [Limisalsivibrio acetivorans]|uniref:RelA/SpoT family protein n=1 Tax=Limisalsivibrio acetivorans TaxID=1304888 RepID=UPI0003B42B49|nr:bifunctional (p)ppGpp synthetase/guanosine-3',5'-bis(diphosphate) 3'-pyrophosphohydrolase [Limisalsivibrio acetivorans]
MDIQDRLVKNGVTEGLEKVHKAYVYAAQKHRGQLRQSGEPYLSHPLNVAYILAEMNMDLDTVIGGLLHDTLEDTDASYDELEELFGDDVAFMVNGVTKIGQIEFKSKEEKQAENFRKMLISMSKDVRVILIKLADRLHNMRTLDHLREEKKVRIAQETMDIYAPMAHRLGIAWIKWELEDRCFRAINPKMYYEIYEKVKFKRGEREQYLLEVMQKIIDELKNSGIEAEVTGRPKHFYSIYNKMVKKKASFEEIYDLLALRIIVESIPHCYGAMGIIHNLWKPIQSRFKDYIAMQKSNLYQSLHTTVVGPKGMAVEFQIRTREMHKVAEEGIAAHWKYKEGKVFDPQEDKTFRWLRSLLEQHDLKRPIDLVEALKEDVLPTQIYVFTPQGDVMELPVGSTPVDFAYSIHTDIGNMCSGAKVDGRMVPLKYRLRNGDRVTIQTSANHKPSRDWLNFVKTNRAKTRIRNYIRKEERDRAIEQGTDLLEREFKHNGLDYREVFNKDANVKKVMEKFGLKEAEDIYVGVGFGRVSPKQIVHVFVDEEKERHTDEDAESLVREPKKRTEEPFIIDGIDDVLVKVAKCCNPLPGDDIVGYITRGRGIVVHRHDCPNIISGSINDERLTPVEWSREKIFRMPVSLKTVIADKPGMLFEIANVMRDMGINISNMQSSRLDDGFAKQDFIIEVKDKKELKTVVSKLHSLEGVQKVSTSQYEMAKNPS